MFLDSGLTSKTISGHWGMFEICRTTDLDNFVSTSCVSTSSGVSGECTQTSTHAHTHTHTHTHKYIYTHTQGNDHNTNVPQTIYVNCHVFSRTDHWTTAMVFEILAFVASFLVILPWILWIMYADILDIFPWSMWLRATTIAMLYITGNIKYLKVIFKLCEMNCCRSALETRTSLSIIFRFFGVLVLCHGVAVAIWYLHEVSPYRIRGIGE